MKRSIRIEGGTLSRKRGPHAVRRSGGGWGAGGRLWMAWAFAGLSGIAAVQALPAQERRRGADPPAVADLLARFDELFESTGTTARIEVTITKPNKVRTMRLRTWSRGEDEVLILVDAPARDAGTATLRVGQNLWNYLPKIARTIRVPPSMMMGSWMGSDLTHDDLVRESSYEEDYTAEQLGQSSDPPGWLVRLTARPEVPGLWNHVEIVFSFDHELPIRAQYFDRKNRLARTLHLGEVTEVGGRLIPLVTTIVPEREEGRKTELRYLEVEFDVELDGKVFSLSELERRH